MIHYTQIIWDEVAFIWKVTGKAVAIFMTGTVTLYVCHPPGQTDEQLWSFITVLSSYPFFIYHVLL